MKICVLLISLVALVCAVPTPQKERRIDDEVLLMFSLIATERAGDNPMHIIDIMAPYLVGEHMELDYEKQLFLLATGGLDADVSNTVLNTFLPMMMSEDKTAEEQLMSLLILAKQFCRKEKDVEISSCPDDEETVIPLLALDSKKGCYGQNFGTNPFAFPQYDHDMCQCKPETDLLFMLSLFDRFSRYSNANGIPSQAPLALMSVMDSMKCQGTLASNGEPCSCEKVTEGQHAVLLQYLLTSPEVQANLKPEVQEKIRNLTNVPAPEARILGSLGGTGFGSNLNLNDFFLSSLSGEVSPSLLSLIANQGESSEEVIRQLILSSLDFDTSAIHILLNNGFQDDENRVGLINYLASLGSLDSTIIPLLLGVENGQDFYLQNLLGSGAIQPLVAMILLGTQSGASQEQLIEYIFEALIRAEEPDYYTSLSRPYVPALPLGLYPGSQLYFAHFELLGINTCALHDLRNRFDCGYVGINAADCETLPYCCYNPVFLTDTEVRNATDNVITTAIDIPWCYYNVFFIYYTEFYMEIQRPGSFASPIQCLGLFKYGIDISPELYYLFDPSSPNSGVGRLVNERLECGFPGMTEFHCVAIRGCCWDVNSPYRIPQCYRPNGPSVFNFNLDNIPAAFLPANGTCNVNNFGVPNLYYARVACHYTINFHQYGQPFDLIGDPNRLDCITRLGCCFEDSEIVVQQYPFVPRCYKREGLPGAIPFGIPSALSLTRSGIIQKLEDEETGSK